MTGARLRGEDVLRAGIATHFSDAADPEAAIVEALAGREGDHLVARLIDAWPAASGPENWERRLELVRALGPFGFQRAYTSWPTKVG